MRKNKKKRKGVSKKKMARKILFSKEEVNKIIESYSKENQTLQNIAKEYKVSRSVIKRVLVEEQVALRESYHYKFFCQYDIFRNINSNEKAYWLGFLAADGCVFERVSSPKKSQGGDCVILSISRKDKEHLVKFQSFLQGNFEIKDFLQNVGFSKNSEMSKIVINSKEMVQDLKDKGIVPRKSLVLKKPNTPSQFYFPYILGYFDGDGSIFQTQQGEFGISFTGTKETLEWINSLLKMAKGIEQKSSLKGKNTFYLRCGGTHKPYFVLQRLYASVDSTVPLQRKFLIFKQLETVVFSRNTK